MFIREKFSAPKILLWFQQKCLTVKLRCLCLYFIGTVVTDDISDTKSIPFLPHCMYLVFQQIMKDSFLKQHWGWHDLKTWCKVGGFRWQHQLPLVFCFYPKPLSLGAYNAVFYYTNVQFVNSLVADQEQNGNIFWELWLLLGRLEVSCIRRTFFGWTLSLPALPDIIDLS